MFVWRQERAHFRQGASHMLVLFRRASPEELLVPPLSTSWARREVDCAPFIPDSSARQSGHKSPTTELTQLLASASQAVTQCCMQSASAGCYAEKPFFVKEMQAGERF